MNLSIEISNNILTKINSFILTTKCIKILKDRNLFEVIQKYFQFSGKIWPAHES